MTSRRRIVYSDADESFAPFFTGPRLDRLRALGDFTIHFGQPATAEACLERMGEADAVVCTWGLPREALGPAKNLEIVAIVGMGVAEYIDLAETARLGITVCRTESAAEAVAEHTMALMLDAARQVTRLDRELRAGRWNQGLPGMDLRGKTLGMIGFGRIARRTVPLAKAFGMRVLAWTRNPGPERAARHGVEFADLDTVLSEADVVAILLPLTAETDGLLDGERLRRTKPGVVLVNTARGAILDETALIELLRSGHIRAAGLDVFAEEPLPPGHPLAGLENVVLTPHSGYNTPEAAEVMLDTAVSNLEAFYAGTPSNVVTI